MFKQIIKKVDFFAVGEMPWIVRVYLFLFFVLVIIMALSGSKLPAQEKLFEISGDLLKIVLGALVGVLSLAANQTWGSNENSGEKANAQDDTGGQSLEEEARSTQQNPSIKSNE